MFLHINILWEYCIELLTVETIYVKFVFSIKLFYIGVSEFAFDCPCSACHRGLTTYFLFLGNFVQN